MSAIPFDTRTFYSELVESGLAEKTAEALTKAVTKIEIARIEELATKRDLKEIELKIELVKSELKRNYSAHVTLKLRKLRHCGRDAAIQYHGWYVLESHPCDWIPASLLE